MINNIEKNIEKKISVWILLMFSLTTSLGYISGSINQKTQVDSTINNQKQNYQRQKIESMETLSHNIRHFSLVNNANNGSSTSW